MIYVECDPELVLVKTLLMTRNAEVKHDYGKSRVCAQLRNSNNSKGVIDEDPGSQMEPYFRSLQEITIHGNQHQLNLRAFKDNPKNNVLLLLCPKMEEWILSACTESSINIGDFNLPYTASELHDRLTLSRKHNMNDFQRLLETLLQINSPRLRILRTLLNE